MPVTTLVMFTPTIAPILLQPNKDASKIDEKKCIPKKGVIPISKPNAKPRAISRGAPFSLIEPVVDRQNRLYYILDGHEWLSVQLRFRGIKDSRVKGTRGANSGWKPETGNHERPCRYSYAIRMNVKRECRTGDLAPAGSKKP